MDVARFVERREPFFLVLVLLLAIALRVDNIRQPLDDAFAWREASTAMMAENLPRNHWNPLWPEVNWTGAGAGYQGREFQTLTVGAAILNQIFGVRDWHGRVVAVLCGLVTCLSLFHLVRTLRTSLEAVLAALVYAISPGAVVTDRSYLPDPAMLALCTASLSLLASGLAARSRTRLRAAAALGIMAILAKPVAVAAVPAGLYLAYKGGSPATPAERIRLILAWCLGCAAVCSLYFGWAIYLGTHYPPYHVAGDWQSSWGEQLGRALFLPRLLAIATGWLWTPVILVLSLAGVLDAVLNRDHRRLPYLFVAWLGGAALLYLFISRELVSNPWNLHISDPPIAALAAAGLVRTVGWIASSGRRRSTIAALALGSAVVAVIVFDARHNVQEMKWGFNYVVDRTMGQHLGTLVGESDLVIVSGRYAGNPLAIYYSGRKGWVFPPPPGEFRVYGSDTDGLAALRVMVADGARWFALAHDAHDMNGTSFAEAYPRLMGLLSRSSEPIRMQYYTLYRLSGSLAE